MMPPFLNTWWFIGGLALLLLAVALVTYRLWLGGVAARRRELERQVEERTHALEQRTRELEDRNQEIEQRRQELEVLYRADEALYRDLDLDHVLQTLVDTAIAMLEADKGALLVWDEDSQTLSIRVAHGFKAETLAQSRFALGEGVVGRVAVSGKPAMVENVDADPRVTRSITDTEGIHAFLQVPIDVGGEVFGVFSADYLQPRHFNQAEVSLLVALAERAALAIRNAQLYEKTQETAARQERSRLARDLHDAVTQTLFSASLIAEVVPRTWQRDQEAGLELLEKLRALNRGALAEMRTLLLELRPAALVETQLDDLLRQLAQAATGREGLPVEVVVDCDCNLPEDVHIALYRISQEALNNVVKHAWASQAKVALSCARCRSGEELFGGPEELVLTIQDDGKGFDPAVITPDHLGLGIMRERADSINARLSVDSAPGRGTLVEVVWRREEPYPAKI
jgi:signal transduction histidine kinase